MPNDDVRYFTCLTGSAPVTKTLLIVCLAGSMAVSSITSAFAESCTTAACHQTIAGLKNPHSPVKDGDCLACHHQVAKVHPAKGNKGFELTAKGAALCAQCHETMGK